MKVIHKFNNGRGATLCNHCNCIISLGLTEDLLCKECMQKPVKIKLHTKDENVKPNI